MEEELCLVQSNEVRLLKYQKTNWEENDNRKIPQEPETIKENENSAFTSISERKDDKPKSKAETLTPTIERERVDITQGNSNKDGSKDTQSNDENDEKKETDRMVEHDGEIETRDNMVTSQKASPPDGGWGWVVLAGSFVVMLLISSIGPCFTLVFSPLFLDLGTSPTTIFWIFGTFSLFWNLVSPAVGPLTEEFGHRKVAVVGSFLVTIGFIASAFAVSSWHLFVCFSLFGGLGAGVLVTISTLIIPVYFDKRRGRANGIFMTGTSIGIFTVPNLTIFLQEHYFYRGAMLILGAILFNTLVSAAVFHPVKWHKKTLVSHGHCAPRKEIQLYGNRAEVEGDCLVPQKQPSITVLKSPVQKVRDEKSVGICNLLYRVCRSTVLSLKILGSPPAFIIALSGTLTLNGYLSFVMMVSFMVESLHSAQESALCVSVAGICSLLARLIMSAMTDCGWFDMRCGYIISISIIALTNLAFPFLTSLEWMAVTMGVWGYGIGSFMGLYNLVMIKYMGVKNLPAMFGSASLLNGLGFISIGPLLGWVKEFTGSYKHSIWTLAAIELLCLILWLIMPAAVLRQNRKSVSASSASV